LPCAGEENPVGVEKIPPIFEAGDIAPAVAAEVVMGPAGVGEAEVAIPGDADPVEFEALDLKFSGGVFKVRARVRIVRLVQEPVNGVHIDAELNGDLAA
jgi:hypothetical protein